MSSALVDNGRLMMLTARALVSRPPGVDRCRDSNLLLVRPRRRISDRPGQLQQIQQQRLQVSQSHCFADKEIPLVAPVI